MGHKFAIDFGMTNSVIAEWDETTSGGRTLDVSPLSISTSTGTFMIPTLLYVLSGQTGEAVMGQEVRDQGLDRQMDNRLFRNFKRTLKTEPIFDARIIDGAPWTEAQAGQIFLRGLLKSLPCPASEIDQLVITVPVAALEEYTSWLSHAIEDIPAEKIRIVDESTAAALGYAVTEPGAIVLVIDFGGGTLDLSLVRLPERGGKAQVIAKAGVSLGGSDIDRWLLQEALTREDLSIAQLGAGYSALLSACEKAKIALSTVHETTLQYSTDTGTTISIPFTRTDLETLLHQKGLFAALRGTLGKVMGLAAQKGVYREDIQHILLVGGTSLVPSIQQTLDDYFRAITQRQRKAIAQMPDWPASTWKIENTSIRVDKPFTAVVEGALQVASGFHLEDQLAYGYGLRHLNAAGEHHFDEVIAAGSPYPSKKPTEVILAASHKNQPFVEFVIGQISTDKPASHVLLNSHQPLKVKLSLAGQPGEPRLRAEFTVDSMRRLRVSVTDLRTRQKMLVDTIIAASNKSDDESDENFHAERISGNEPALAHRSQNKLQSMIHAFTSLFKYAAPERVSAEAFLADLRSEDSLKRFDAANALARRGDRAARIAFEDILQTGTPHQRASAARHLHHFSWFAAETFFRMAFTDDERVQEAAMFALCKMRTPEAYRLATEILQSGNDAMCLSAVWGMYNHPDPAAIPVLTQTLRAQNPEVRTLTLEVLGATESPEAIPVVKTAMNDTDPEVQYAATLSWVELAREACFLELAGCIEEAHGWSRRWILRGFFHATNYMGIEAGLSPDAAVLIRALERSLQDELPQARLAAFLPLTWIRHPNAERILMQGYQKETDSDTKAHMLTAAVHLMSPAAGRLLEDARQGSDRLVRQTAEFLKQPSM